MAKKKAPIPKDSPKLRYISVQTVKKNKRITEYVVVKSYKIRYRDRKNRIVKFDARKKLRVEVQFLMSRGEVVPKTWHINSDSYGLPLRKRKKPVSDTIIQNQIKRKHALKLKKGHMIVSEVGDMNNLVSWTYYYEEKTKAQKAKERKQKLDKVRKEKKQKKAQRLAEVKKKLSRSHYGNKKTKGSSKRGYRKAQKH